MEKQDNDHQQEEKFDTPCAWLVIAAIVVCQFSGPGLLFGTATVFAGEYPALLNKTESETNVIGSVATGTFLISTPLVSALCNQLGSRITSACGFVLIMTSLVVSAFGTKIWHFVLGYSILCGLGATFYLTAAVQIVPHYCKKYLNAGFASIGLGGATAFLAFPAILSAIKQTGVSFRDLNLYLMIICLGLICGPIIFRPRLRNQNKIKIKLADIIQPFKRCPTLVYLLQAYLWNVAFLGFLIFLFTQVSTHFGNEEGTLSAMLFGVGEVVSAVILPLILLKTRPNITILQICINLVAGVAIIVFGAITDLYLYHVTAFIVGACHSAIICLLPCHSHWLYSPAEAQMAYAYQQAIGGVSGFLGPLSATFIKTLYGTSAAYYYLGAQGLLAGIVIIVNAVAKPSILKPIKSGQVKQGSDSEAGTVEIGSDNRELNLTATENSGEDNPAYSVGKPINEV